jgi:hypothetical protein
MTRKTYCGNLLWQSGLLAPKQGQEILGKNYSCSSPDELRIAGVMKNAGVEGDTIEVQEIENENNQLVLGRPMRNVVLSVNNIK